MHRLQSVLLSLCCVLSASAYSGDVSGDLRVQFERSSNGFHIFIGGAAAQAQFESLERLVVTQPGFVLRQRNGTPHIRFGQTCEWRMAAGEPSSSPLSGKVFACGSWRLFVNSFSSSCILSSDDVSDSYPCTTSIDQSELYLHVEHAVVVFDVEGSFSASCVDDLEGNVRRCSGTHLHCYFFENDNRYECEYQLRDGAFREFDPLWVGVSN